MIETTAPVRASSSARPRGQRSAQLGRMALGGVSALSYLFLYVPIAVLVIYSFTTDTFGVRWTGFTLDWYRRLFEDERMIEAALNTLKVALISTIVSTVLGTLIALAMERYRFRGRVMMDGLLYLPIVIPEIVMALALLAFFAFSFGLFDLIAAQLGLPPLNLRLSLTTVIIAHIAFSISFVVVVVRASLRGFDERLEEAAYDLGANEWQTFWKVTFPLILPGILGGALLAFTISLDDFIITFFTTGSGASLLPIEVYGKVKRAVTPQINAISTIMLALSMVLVALSQLAQRRR
jgi:spermidine/putrescine transport system permease protein